MGRKALVTDNELYGYIRFVCGKSLEGIPSWMDDFIMGACYTSAGFSRSKLNVSPTHVKSALFLMHISTDSILSIYKVEGMSKRTAQRVAKAARFALDGIKHYLDISTEENQTMKQAYKMESKFIAEYYSLKPSTLYSPPKRTVPEEILSLYKSGKYLEYGEALREFRINVG